MDTLKEKKCQQQQAYNVTCLTHPWLKNHRELWCEVCEEQQRHAEAVANAFGFIV